MICRYDILLTVYITMDKGKELIAKAVDLDKKGTCVGVDIRIGNYEEAIQCYKEGCKYLLQSLRCTRE